MSLIHGDTRQSLKNRRRFLEGLEIDFRNLVCAKQAHGNNIARVTQKDSGRGSDSCASAILDTDALITNEKNVPLAVFTADCLSVFLFDPNSRAIGIVHAGWRSTRENIIRRTTEAMKDALGAAAQDLLAEFGPAIRGCCYEVGSEVADRFPGFISEREGRLYLDLAGVNREQLLEAGVSEKNILDPRLCTSCDNDILFSFRKEGADCARMISVAMLK